MAQPEVTLQQREMILATLRAVLDCPQFCKSKRYPSFLEYVVHQALEENSHSLKERTVGVEVFGRPANYDTSTDPVVRVAAGEVRRRMAAYFSEHPEAPVRIDIPPGSYHAEFCFLPHDEHAVAVRASTTTQVGHVPTDASNAISHSVAHGPRIVSAQTHPYSGWLTGPRLALAAILVAIAAGAGWWVRQHERMREEFWWPVLGQSQPALILVGRTGEGTTQSNPVTATSESDLALDDAIVAAQICSAFREYQLPCKVSSAALASVEDIHGRSLVLIGGYSNRWTRRLLAPLPYQLKFSPADGPVEQRSRVIVERKPPGDIALATIANNANPTAEFSKDYAVVARFHSDITDGMAVVVAGLGRPGTSSAGQYLASRERMQELMQLAPKDWKGTNFEAVLETDVVQGSSGHVKVIAARFW